MTKPYTIIQLSTLLKTLSLILACCLICVSFNAHAETVSIPIGQQGQSQQIDKPALGMTMEQVRQAFGSPVTQSPPRGNPPITRWEYNQFVTYFEDNIVIHSVTKHQRQD